MSLSPPTPDDRYAALVEALRNQPGVTYLSDGPPSNKFGSNALKVNQKIFAMLV